MSSLNGKTPQGDPSPWGSDRLRVRRGELPRERQTPEAAEAARLQREPDEILSPLDDDEEPPPVEDRHLTGSD